MKHPWVILFDIDGTLLTVESSFNRPLLRSIISQVGIDYDGLESDSFAGRTDHDILTSFLENHGYDQNLYQKLKSVYLNRLSSEITADHIRKHSHVDEAIEYFSQEGFIPGLLTGNFPIAAEVKLSTVSIDLNYKIGAFGDFHKDRNMLPQLALDKAEQLLDIEADPQRFVIIGDTPRDIECAKSNGMKSVAVTTGSFNREQLEIHHPDLIIDSLQNPQFWFEELVSQPV